MSADVLARVTDTEGPIADHPGAPLAARVDDRLTLRLARPAEHNRLDPLDVDALHALFAALATAEPATRPRWLAITGSGERTFSSGYTLQSIRGELDDRFERMIDALESLPLPTLAALNGSVYGGATDLALACDFRIGVTGTRMFIPPARIGLHYYPGGLRRYVTRLGLTAASKLMLTGQAIDDEEMLRIGFLTERVAPGELDAAVGRWHAAIAATDPGVVASMKAAMHAIANGSADWPALQAAYAASVRSETLAHRLEAMLSAGRRNPGDPR